MDTLPSFFEPPAPRRRSPAPLRVRPGDRRPLVWFEGTGTASTNRRYLSADERGSIIRIANSNGATVATNRYDEYGVPAATNSGRFQYTGQAWLSELGLYYYKARLYSPGLGRFMQIDPIGYKGGINLYAYSSNDPVNSLDPSGMCTASRIDVAEGSICMGSGTITIYVSASSPTRQERIKRLKNVRVSVVEDHTYSEESLSAEAFFEENDQTYQATKESDQELLGAVIRMRDASYRHTTAAVVPSSFSGTLRISGLSGWISAILHSHPFGGGELFSPRDVSYVKENRLNSYLRTPWGGLRLLTPRAARFADDDGSIGVNACSVTGPTRPLVCIGN